MEDYTDFLNYLNESITKVQELLEKVTIIHNEVAITLLETSKLYNPQILIDLSVMATNATKFDEYILEGQEVKNKLETLARKPHQSTDYYETLLKELQIIESSFTK